jgi:hypothetical protein
MPVVYPTGWPLRFRDNALRQPYGRRDGPTFYNQVSASMYCLVGMPASGPL